MMLNLILASIQSILQVIIIVLFGSFLTKAGYFTTEKQKWLSKLNMVFFTPCLLFSNIASVISFEKLLAYWPIPVFYLTFASLSYISTQLISRIVRLSEPYRRFALACTMFSNTNSLPIAVIASLAVSEGGKVLYWGADDTQNDVAARGISYTLFFAIFGNILRWSYGYSLLQNDGKGGLGSDEGTVVVEYGATHHGDEEISQHLSSPPSSLSRRSLLDDAEEGQIFSRPDSTTTIAGEHHKPVNETTSLLSSFPHLPGDENDNKQRPAWVEKIVKIARLINSYMTPPLYAALLALFVGLIPPLKDLMYDKQGFLYPSLTSAIQSCGKAAVPIILVCLGAQLTDILQMHRSSLALTKPVMTAVAVRTLLLPLMVIPIVIAFVNFGSSWSAIASDPVFSTMMIIVGCTPTAINLVQICQVTGAFEDDMLRVLFWSYGVICVPMFTLVVFLALNIVDRFL